MKITKVCEPKTSIIKKILRCGKSALKGYHTRLGRPVDDLVG
jgi:hypothetical protein